MFTYNTTVKMHDTDAAGIIFFGNQLKMIHDAYESLIESVGFSFATILRDFDFFVPIVHVEANYKAPLFVGDKITIEVILEKIGETSFIFSFKLLNDRRKIVGTAKTVHVTVDNKTHKKIPLPPKLRKTLESLK
jgi:1,4-dihydroxy-2-naphthoyl-CoA hydrolase